MEKAKAVLSIGGIVAAAGLVLVGVFTFASHFLIAQDTCTKKGATHTVILQNDKATPEHTTGKLCDKLTITNKDSDTRLVAFGPHEHHVAYDFVTEKSLSQDQSLTITLNKTGTYHFHDHIGDVIQGDFTVTQ